MLREEKEKLLKFTFTINQITASTEKALQVKATCAAGNLIVISQQQFPSCMHVLNTTRTGPLQGNTLGRLKLIVCFPGSTRKHTQTIYGKKT